MHLSAATFRISHTKAKAKYFHLIVLVINFHTPRHPSDIRIIRHGIGSKYFRNAYYLFTLEKRMVHVRVKTHKMSWASKLFRTFPSLSNGSECNKVIPN